MHSAAEDCHFQIPIDVIRQAPYLPEKIRRLYLMYSYAENVGHHMCGCRNHHSYHGCLAN